MKNPELREFLRTLTISYLSWIQQRFDLVNGMLPTFEVPQLIFGDGEFVKYDIVRLPNWSHVVGSTFQSWAEEPRFKSVLEEAVRFKDASRLLAAPEGEGGPSAFANGVFKPFVLKQLMAQQQVRFAETVFESNYAAVEVHLYENVDQYRITAPLGNFRLGSKSMSVGRFLIRELDPTEAAAFNQISTDPMSFLSFTPHLFKRCAIQLDVKVPRAETPATPTNYDLFWWLLACLKLLTAGSVRYDQLWFRPTGWTGMTLRVGSPFSQPLAWDRIYRLGEGEVDRLRSIWEAAEKTLNGPPPFWLMALHRFCDGVDRLRKDEGLVDFWIACESLFGEKQDRGELTYKLSLRLSHFLTAIPAERERVRSAAREAYNSRSQVVHGVEKLNLTKISGSADVMEDLTRRALERCLTEAVSSKQEMLRRLETSITGFNSPTDPAR